MQNDDDALLASHGQLVKMPITLEPHGIFSLNLAYLYILRLSSVYQIKLNNNRQQENNALIFKKDPSKTPK